MKITIEKNKETLLQKASSSLKHYFFIYSKFPILFLTSGGSAFELFSKIDPQDLPSNTTISVLDERFDVRHKINNFSQLMKTDFFTQAARNGSTFIDTRVKRGDTFEIFSVNFNAALKLWRQENPNGKIIITLGVGEDGHTAGIMPFPEDPDLFKVLFENKDQWAVGYDATGKNPYPLRITTTIEFLTKEVDNAIVWALGEKKKEALQKVLSQQENLYEAPARVLHRMKDVELYTDVTI